MNGLWRSLVARLHGVQEAAGSNPVSPIFSSAVSTYRADSDRLLERGDFVFPFGDELLAQVASVSCLLNRADDGRIVEFLGFIDFRPAGNATRVVVGDVLMMLLDGGDDIPLHDLHVVNVIEELEVRG